MRHEQTIEINSMLDRTTWRYLHSHRTETRQSEDETIVKTATFDDGRQMDVKCCGTQDGPSWTEAVLFDENGTQICFTEPAENFTGDWELESDGETYVVHVVVEPAAEPAARIGILGIGHDERMIIRYVDPHVDDENVVAMIREAATAYFAENPEAYDEEQCRVDIRTVIDNLGVADTEPFGFVILGDDHQTASVDPLANLVDPNDVPEYEE